MVFQISIVQTLFITQLEKKIKQLPRLKDPLMRFQINIIQTLLLLNSNNIKQLSRLENPLMIF
jgi:hypothetical protein